MNDPLYYTTDGHARRMEIEDSLDEMGGQLGLTRRDDESIAAFRHRIRKYLQAPHQATQRGIEAALVSIAGVHSANMETLNTEGGKAVYPPVVFVHVVVGMLVPPIEEFRAVMDMHMPAGVGWEISICRRVDGGRLNELATVTGPV